jgi:hypothetical protein
VRCAARLARFPWRVLHQGGHDGQTLSGLTGEVNRVCSPLAGVPARRNRGTP